MTVPASVPSLFHSAVPFTPSLAGKYTMPPTAAIGAVTGMESFGPGRMSFTSAVRPEASTFHNSVPSSPPRHAKNTTSPAAVSPSGAANGAGGSGGLPASSVRLSRHSTGEPPAPQCVRDIRPPFSEPA
jgi:hypothetical protein